LAESDMRSLQERTQSRVDIRNLGMRHEVHHRCAESKEMIERVTGALERTLQFFLPPISAILIFGSLSGNLLKTNFFIRLSYGIKENKDGRG